MVDGPQPSMARRLPVTRMKRVALSIALAAQLAVACDPSPEGPRASEPRPACPAGTERDPKRQAALEQQLGADLHAASLVRATAGRVVVCFGAGIEPGVDARHRVRLAAGRDDAEAAAKLAHLLLHVTEGLPWHEQDRRPCAIRLAEARDREERAQALEATLLRSFGRPAPDDSEVDRVLASYAARCASSRETSAQPSSSK